MTSARLLLTWVALPLCFGCGQSERAAAGEQQAGAKRNPLAEEARRRGIDREPTVRQRIDLLLATELIGRVRRKAEQAVTEVQARQFFQANVERFVEPARIELHYVAVRDGTRAAGLQKRLAGLPDSRARAAALRQAGRRHAADTAGRERGAYLGWLTADRARGLCGAAPEGAGGVTAGTVGTTFAVCVWGRRRGAGQRDFASARKKVLRLLRNRAGKAAVDELRRRFGA